MDSVYVVVLIAVCSAIYFSKDVKADCGGLIEEHFGTIRSPSYHSRYSPNQRCIWEIKMPPTMHVGLQFRHFELEGSYGCVRDSLTIKSKMEDGSLREHGKFCGEEAIPNIYSDSNILLIEFISDRRREYKGFELEFLSDKCGGLIEVGKGHINSPFFPDSYSSNRICEWIFEVPPQHKVKLHFLQFEIEEGGDDCSNDFLQIQSKTPEGEIHEYGKYCGDSGPSLIQSKNSLLVTFLSDRTFQRKGFKLEYAIDKLTDYELSTSLMRSATPVYLPFTLTTVSYNDENEKVTLINETDSFSDALEQLSERVASIVDTQKILLSNNENIVKFSSAIASTTSAYAPSNSMPEDQEIDEYWIALRNETNILSDGLKLLAEKVTSLEDNLKTLKKNNEDVLKISRLLSSNDAILKEEGKTSSSSSERKVPSDCEKCIFFLRQKLDSEN